MVPAVTVKETQLMVLPDPGQSSLDVNSVKSAMLALEEMSLRLYTPSNVSKFDPRVEAYTSPDDDADK